MNCFSLVWSEKFFIYRQLRTYISVNTIFAMKCFGALIFLCFYSICFAQGNSARDIATYSDPDSAFKISFTTFNHAQRLYNGITTYILTASSIKVKKVFLGDTTSKTVFARRIGNKHNLIATFDKLRLDSIEDYYFNYCVMITSGNEYFLTFENRTTKRRVSLHHYYLKQFDDIVQIINANLPRKYRCQYLTKDTKQDCQL